VNVVYNNEVIQSGQQVYQGGIITIPQVTIYKEGVQLQVAIDSASLTGTMPDESMIAYPNPFATSTTIRWQVNEQGKCSIKIFDVQGRVIKTLLDGDFTPGIHQLIWNGDNDLQHPVSNGIYLIRLDTPDHSETKKVIVGR
jgi:flagellar hook assembly protein FlgD